MTRLLNLVIYSGLLIFLLSILSACEKNPRLEKLKQTVTQVRETLEKNPPQKPVAFQLPSLIKYQAEVAPEETNTTSVRKPYTLTYYPVLSLQFLGIIEENNQIWAYVMTPDNITYQVKEGDKIGNKQGRIVKITTDHIDLLEKAPTANGKLAPERIVTLKLKG